MSRMLLSNQIDGLSKNIFSKEVMSARDHHSMYCGLIFSLFRGTDGSLASYSPWGSKESDTTEQLNTQHAHNLFKGLQLLSCSFLVTAGMSKLEEFTRLEDGS